MRTIRNAKCRVALRGVLWVEIGLLLVSPLFSAERLDRGLVALECEAGAIYIGWRMLNGDSDDTSFELTRKGPGTNRVKLPLAHGGRRTNHLDLEARVGETYTYRLREMANPTDSPPASVTRKVTGTPRPYVRIVLQEADVDFQKIGLGDLNGDGRLDYVIKTPNFNTDPYQRPGYWKKSPTTYKLEAYDHDGSFLWRYDMGWAIETGIWYSPWIVYDIDQDGRAEVYCKAGEGDPRDERGHVKSGPEYLVRLDGQSGRVMAMTPWLDRDGYQDYNRWCRNFLTVAYLDGHTPSLIMQRGTYRLIKTQALDKDFQRIWYWEASGNNASYRGQGSHGLISADVDDDGHDELVIGAACIDEHGRGLWSLKMGHPDVCYVADIAQNHPGLEVFYGFETAQKTDGICLVEAQSGRKLWTHKQPTRHIHSQGMIGDILADYPGMEVYGGERDSNDRWLYSADGKLIEHLSKGSLNPHPLWWDADPLQELILTSAIQDWGGKILQPIEGQFIASVDCLGDYREEVITSVAGEIRIYSTTIPSASRRPCLLQDHQYRMGVVAQTMGYYYRPQLGLQAGKFTTKKKP